MKNNMMIAVKEHFDFGVANFRKRKTKGIYYDEGQNKRYSN